LEIEEKLEVKKYQLAIHYGIDPTQITPEFVKTFNKGPFGIILSRHWLWTRSFMTQLWIGAIGCQK